MDIPLPAARLGDSELRITPIGFGAWAVGARTPEQVDGFIGAATFRLSAEEIGRIAALTAQGDAAVR